MLLPTAETIYRDMDNVPPAARAALIVRAITAQQLPVAEHPTRRAQVEVNHGRWIISCPLQHPLTRRRCAGAQMASVSDQRYFCEACLNAEVGLRWIRVDWPSAALIDQIESELIQRPDKDKRNWLPGETIADLQAQRIAHQEAG